MWHWGTHSLHSFSFETSDKTTASKYKSKISFQIVLHSPPPSQPSLLGKFSSYKSKLTFHLIFIESSRPWWRLNISSLGGKYFTFLKSNQQSSCIERYGPAIISAQWCIMIIHYEPNIKTCPSPRQMQCAASDSGLNIIMTWRGAARPHSPEMMEICSRNGKLRMTKRA